MVFGSTKVLLMNDQNSANSVSPILHSSLLSKGMVLGLWKEEQISVGRNCGPYEWTDPGTSTLSDSNFLAGADTLLCSCTQERRSLPVIMDQAGGGQVMREIPRWDVGQQSSLFQKGEKGESLKLHLVGSILKSLREWFRGSPEEEANVLNKIKVN